MPHDDSPLAYFARVPRLPLPTELLADSEQEAVSGGASGLGFSPPPPPELPKKPSTPTPWYLIN